MLKIKQTIYPDSLNEALALLHEGGFRPYAGGTDLIPAIRDGRLKDYSFLMMSRFKEELSGISLDADNNLRIGAMTLLRDITENKLIHQYIPVLAEACAMIGSMQIRNRATIGGNIVNASPAADTVPVLTAAGALIEISSVGSVHHVPIGEFATAPGKTILRSKALVTAVVLPIPEGGWSGNYMKAGIRNALTISIASAALLHNPEQGWRIALGSVAPTVVRAQPLEKIFNESGSISKSSFDQILSTVAKPIGDVRASARYRLDVLNNVLYHAYEQRGISQ